jgi:hypothetical protein
MREVWIRAAMPAPLAAALEGGAIAMVVVLKPGEVMTLRDSINLVGSAVAACSRSARTLREIVAMRGTPAPDVAETVRMMIEPLARAEQLHETTRQLLSRAVFVSGESDEAAGKGVAQ